MNAHNARRTSLPARVADRPPSTRRRQLGEEPAPSPAHPAAISPHPPPPPPPPLPRRRRRLPCRRPEYRGGGLASASKKGRWPPPRMPRSCGHTERALLPTTHTHRLCHCCQRSNSFPPPWCLVYTPVEWPSGSTGIVSPPTHVPGSQPATVADPVAAACERAWMVVTRVEPVSFQCLNEHAIN